MKERGKIKFKRATGVNCIKYNVPGSLYHHCLASHEKCILQALSIFFQATNTLV